MSTSNMTDLFAAGEAERLQREVRLREDLEAEKAHAALYAATVTKLERRIAELELLNQTTLEKVVGSTVLEELTARVEQLELERARDERENAEDRIELHAKSARVAELELDLAQVAAPERLIEFAMMRSRNTHLENENALQAHRLENFTKVVAKLQKLGPSVTTLATWVIGADDADVLKLEPIAGAAFVEALDALADVVEDLDREKLL